MAKKMSKEKKKSLYRKLAVIFAILTLFAGVFTVADIALCAGWLKVLSDVGNSTGNPNPYVSPSKNDVYFFEKIDLGPRSDGYYYSIAKMGNEDDFYNNGGEYVVLKKNGSYPEVDFFQELPPEYLPANRYRIDNVLPGDEFSDLIDDNFRNTYPDVFTGKTDDMFAVVDVDHTIQKTSGGLRQDIGRSNSEAVFAVMGIGFFSLLSYAGAIIAIPLCVITILLFFMALIFLILYREL